MIQLKHLKLLIHEIILWYTADGFITMAEKISDQKLLGNWNVSNYQFSLKYRNAVEPAMLNIALCCLQVLTVIFQLINSKFCG